MATNGRNPARVHLHGPHRQPEPAPEPRWWHTPDAEPEPAREPSAVTVPPSWVRLAVVPNRRMVIGAGVLVVVLLVIVGISSLIGSSSSSSSSSTAAAPSTTTPLGCDTHVVDSSGDTALSDPYCTENALASRYCAVTLTAAPEDLGSALYWPGGSDGYARLTTWGGSAPGSGGSGFQCANYPRGLSRSVTFTDLQWDLLMTPGPDDPAIETMLGPAHR